MPSIYQVGGCVRDRLLGVTPKDYDFVYVSDDVSNIENAFEEMTNYLQENGYKIFLSTPDCFTIRARFPTSHQFKNLTADFVLARKEISYADNSRKPECVPSNLYDDLERRDFTINAMAEDEEGNLIDYFNGTEDLEEGILRTPTDPLKSFGDDPLRLIRAMRFNITRNFEFSDEVKVAFNNPELWKKLKLTVSTERIRDELFKCFSHDTVHTLRFLQNIDDINSNILDNIFSGSLWLKPTMEKQK